MTRGVRLEDLPAAVRRRVTDRAVPVVPAPTKTRARRTRTTGQTWRCHACGELSTTWAGAERHAHGERHLRVELVL